MDTLFVHGFIRRIEKLLENNKIFIENKVSINQKIISLSIKNISEEIRKGNFIETLYNRLGVIKIETLPIIFRREDILPIFNFYLSYYNKNKNFKFIFSKNAKSKLELYDWPGNIAQIINYAEKTIILNTNFSDKESFEIEDLPMDMGDYENSNMVNNNYELSLKEARNIFEKNYLLSQIKRFNGNIRKISDFTGMERTALYRKFKSLDIEIEKKQ